MCYLCPLVSGLWTSLCTVDGANSSVFFLLACIYRWWPGHVLHLQCVFSVLGTYGWALVRSTPLKHGYNVSLTFTWTIMKAKSWGISFLLLLTIKHLIFFFRSEHERHSPNCPFVKGEHTQNVPLSVTLATSPAQFPSADGSDKIVCYGFGSCPHFLATATKRGKICIWDVLKLMKVCCSSLSLKWTRKMQYN